MGRLLFVSLFSLIMSGCIIVPHEDEMRDHRTVQVIGRDDDNDAIATFTLEQRVKYDDSDIYLSVKNTSSQTLSFTFTIHVSGYYDSFDHTNSIVELAPGSVKKFGKISDAHVNIYDAHIWLAAPIYVVYTPTANG